MAAIGEDVKTWITIYPAYLDASKTVVQGRKVAKDVAVAKPTLAEIVTCVRKLGLLLVEEPNKAYSRDPVMEVGRLKVQLKVNGSIVNPDIPNRTILIYIETFLLDLLGPCVPRTPVDFLLLTATAFNFSCSSRTYSIQKDLRAYSISTV
jgi:signal recognition particle subunit SEC65